MIIESTPGTSDRPGAGHGDGRGPGAQLAKLRTPRRLAGVTRAGGASASALAAPVTA
jgi:hypothetical protein